MNFTCGHRGPSRCAPCIKLVSTRASSRDVHCNGAVNCAHPQIDGMGVMGPALAASKATVIHTQEIPDIAYRFTAGVRMSLSLNYHALRR